MTNIGLDFGTTYSVLATPKNPDEGDYTPQPVMLYGQDTSPFYDSLALRTKDGSFSYGRQARDKITRNGTVAYKGFKLLLAEENPEILKERGFSSDVTPDNIVRGYINDLLMKYKTKYGDINRLVVGVPEIWVENSARQKCYEYLFDIVKGVADELFPKAKTDILLVSEPTCACAYYVEKYKALNDGNIFTGNILIVDYGGGTLDIALCRVEDVDGTPKVTPLKRSGAGANEEKIIGKAGFAFMEEVVRLALFTGGVSQESISSERNKGSLYSCIYQVEAAFMDLSSRDDTDENVKRFREVFDGWDDIEEKYDTHDIFATIEFMEVTEENGRIKKSVEEYDVDYGMIARAFNEKIRPVLDEKLDVIIQYMDTEGIEYGVNSDQFKIQRIGGFCNFYLVEQEINEKMKRSAVRDDKRYYGELVSSDDRTLAIAYGASLLANKQTDYGLIWQHSLGLPVRVSIGSNKTIPLWAVKEGEELAIDKVYLFKYENGNAALLQADGIKEITYQCDGKAEPISMLPRYVKLLEMKESNYYIIGVSQNRSKILSFHWWAVSDTDTASKYLKKIEEMIATGEIEMVECFGKEQCVSLTKVFNLSGDAPVALSV